MREIKFRAWADGEMYEDVGTIPMSSDKRFGVERHRWSFRPNEADLMQFTGLLDKNGKEIYEGDIITGWKGSNEPYAVELEPVGSFWYWNGEYGDEDKFEVIGNIYENPDPLPTSKGIKGANREAN